jgi:general secretion pathway protein E
MQQAVKTAGGEHRLTLGEILDGLIEDKLISAEAAELLKKERRYYRGTMHPLTIVADQKWKKGTALLTLDALAEWLAKRVGLEYLHIDPLKIDFAAVTEVMSSAYATRFRILPVGVSAKETIVATAEPHVREWEAELARMSKREIRRVIANPLDIERYQVEFYNLARSIKGASRTASAGSGLSNFEQLVELGKSDKQFDANDAHIVRIVDWLWQYAFEQRASDIHIEPRREQGIVRFRIDGVLHQVYQIPAAVLAAMTSRIKILARMDVVEKRRPQDGRIKTARGDREVEMRVSTIAVAFGEKLVIRIFDPGTLLRDLAEVGMFEPQLQAAEKFLARPHGLILVTGPTGSGKTTTLYAALRTLATPEVNVVTIEDPIEIVVEAFNQVAVQPKIGFGFAEALRHVLRQDPDVIMVGEVRDGETAEIALQAALTGHMVLASLHTNDASSAVTRLLELGVDPFVLSSTLTGVVAQRLVRTVCSSCRVETFLTPDQLTLLGLDVQELRAQGQEPELMVAFGEGCVLCRSTGLLGRTGVFEVLEVDDKIRKLIVAKANSKEILKQARRDGFLTLREAAVKKLAKGMTSFEEVLRVTAEG